MAQDRAILAQLRDGVLTNRFSVGRDGLRIGRATDNEVCIDDPLVSKRHAVIEVVADRDGEHEYYIADLESTNHTFVNGERVDDRRRLRNHDEVVVGGLHAFKFFDGSESPPDTKKVRKSWIPGIYYTR